MRDFDGGAIYRLQRTGASDAADTTWSMRDMVGILDTAMDIRVVVEGARMRRRELRRYPHTVRENASTLRASIV